MTTDSLAQTDTRPVPDPTQLTDQAIAKAVVLLTQYVDGQISVLTERLRGIDEATKLRLDLFDHLENRTDDKVGRLADLTAERFGSIATQFRERDIRAEREARDNKVAVDAAFAAQKEAAAKQDEANAKAIDKSERSTAETIKTNLELTRTQTDSLVKGLDEVKGRVTVIESTKAGAVENRTGLYATVGIIATIFFLIIGVLAFIAGQAR